MRNEAERPALSRLAADGDAILGLRAMYFLLQGIADRFHLLKYGLAISAAVKFIAIALFLFMVIKAINSTKKKEEAAPAAPAPTPEDIQLLREIRDALKK